MKTAIPQSYSEDQEKKQLHPRLNNNNSLYLTKLLSEERYTQSKSENRTSEIKDNGIDFLLAEYNSITELWKQTDVRLESGINIYLATNTLFISAIAFFSQGFKDVNLFLFVATIIALALYAAGRILARRILATALTKFEYFYARDLIREYFANRSPEIAPHLYFLSSNFKEPNYSKKDKIALLRIPKSLLTVLHLWASILLGFAFTAQMWIISIPVSISTLLAVGALICILCFIYFTMDLKKRVELFHLRQYKP